MATSPITREELQFNPLLHEYRYRGKGMPSVTQVLKDTGLIDDRWYTQESRTRGKAVHLATEYDDKGVLDASTVSPGVLVYLNAWRAFRAETGFTPALIEHRVCHSTAQYGGTIDRAGEMRDAEWIIDLKSGAHQRWHPWQLAAYAMALPDPRKYRRGRVELRANGSYQFTEFPMEDLSADYAIFSHARMTWQFQARRIS